MKKQKKCIFYYLSSIVLLVIITGACSPEETGSGVDSGNQITTEVGKTLGLVGTWEARLAIMGQQTMTLTINNDDKVSRSGGPLSQNGKIIRGDASAKILTVKWEKSINGGGVSPLDENQVYYYSLSSDGKELIISGGDTFMPSYGSITFKKETGSSVNDNNQITTEVGKTLGLVGTWEANLAMGQQTMTLTINNNDTVSRSGGPLSQNGKIIRGDISAKILTVKWDKLVSGGGDSPLDENQVYYYSLSSDGKELIISGGDTGMPSYGSITFKKETGSSVNDNNQITTEIGKKLGLVGIYEANLAMGQQTMTLTINNNDTVSRSGGPLSQSGKIIRGDISAKILTVKWDKLVSGGGNSPLDENQIYHYSLSSNGKELVISGGDTLMPAYGSITFIKK